MARVVICDDEEATVSELATALIVCGHKVETCQHAMDVLRDVANGLFDLVTIGLDMNGFVRTGAIEALHELAPRVALIALHARPSEIMRAATRAGFAAVLPRPVSVEHYLAAVACALEQAQRNNHSPATRRCPPSFSETH
jgi:DNA-binding NtrC family response regulator